MNLTLLNIFLYAGESGQVKAVAMAIVVGVLLFVKSLFSKKDE